MLQLWNTVIAKSLENQLEALSISYLLQRYAEYQE